MKQEDINNLKQLRKEIFLAAYAGGMGHLASAYSSLEILYTLYAKDILRYEKDRFDEDIHDHLVLSKGHASLALYSVLYQSGFFGKDVLYSFSQPGSILGGEPERGKIPGIETSTGSLGHGMSIGEGIALADKIKKRRTRTYVLIGDGECQEGSIWESALSCAGLGLDNIIVVLDCNHIQKMGKVSEVIGNENWKEKWEAFGWQVDEVDGHDVDELENCLKKESQRGPRIILAETVKGKGISLMENNPAWHWRMPGKRERKVFMEELGIAEEELKYAKGLYNGTI